MKLPSTWTTIPGRSTSSRPATECTPAWPCSPIWPTRSGKTGAGGIGVKPVCSNPNCITQTEHYLPPLVKQNGGVDCCAYCDKELR